MKIFLTTDWHIGVFPLKVDVWRKMQEDYFYNFFIPMLLDKYEEGDILIHLGDLYDNRNSIDIRCMNMAEDIITKISKILPVYMIVGNHDLYNKSSNDVNSVNLFNHIDNVSVYTETTQLEIEGKKLVLMPWIESKTEQITMLKRFSGGDYLFCHSDLNNCRMHLSSVAWKNNNKIDVDEFASYKHCFSGHIHLVQTNKNFTFIGAPYQMDRNDYGDKKGVYILDSETGDTEFIPNNYSPEFVKLSIITEDDIYKLENLDTSKNYVDLSISNSLLINNRKVRRNIETILEKGNFSKIEYISDVVKKEVIESEIEAELEEIDITNIQLDEMENIVLKYIEKREYSSKEVKDGITSEYMKILSIYKNEYKFIKDV